MTNKEKAVTRNWFKARLMSVDSIFTNSKNVHTLMEINKIKVIKECVNYLINNFDFHSIELGFNVPPFKCSRLNFNCNVVYDTTVVWDDTFEHQSVIDNVSNKSIKAILIDEPYLIIYRRKHIMKNNEHIIKTKFKYNGKSNTVTE